MGLLCMDAVVHSHCCNDDKSDTDTIADFSVYYIFLLLEESTLSQIISFYITFVIFTELYTVTMQQAHTWFSMFQIYLNILTTSFKYSWKHNSHKSFVGEGSKFKLFWWFSLQFTNK